MPIASCDSMHYDATTYRHAGHMACMPQQHMLATLKSIGMNPGMASGVAWCTNQRQSFAQTTSALNARGASCLVRQQQHLSCLALPVPKNGASEMLVQHLRYTPQNPDEHRPDHMQTCFTAMKMAVHCMHGPLGTCDKNMHVKQETCKHASACNASSASRQWCCCCGMCGRSCICMCALSAPVTINDHLGTPRACPPSLGPVQPGANHC